jgi:hypothetical protein
MYRLKKTTPAFEVVDGPFARRKYLHGRFYAEIPPEHKGRFETVEARPEAKTAAAETAPKAEGGKKK